MNKHTIDATDKALGRLSSEIAVLLRGKNRATYQPNVLPQEEVTVENVAKMKISGNKLTQKKYFHYSGYPGGMRARGMDEKMAKDPAWVLRHAVYRMLASNKLRDKIIKHLIIK